MLHRWKNNIPGRGSRVQQCKEGRDCIWPHLPGNKKKNNSGLNTGEIYLFFLHTRKSSSCWHWFSDSRMPGTRPLRLFLPYIRKEAEKQRFPFIYLFLFFLSWVQNYLQQNKNSVKNEERGDYSN